MELSESKKKYIASKYRKGFPIHIDTLAGLCGFPEAMKAAFEKASWDWRIYLLTEAQAEMLLNQMYATWTAESPKDAPPLIAYSQAAFDYWKSL